MKTRRTNHFRTVRWLSPVLFALMLTLPLGAWADGTEAGLSISNTVTLDFQVNGEDQTQVDDTVAFTVDRKLDVVVDEVSGGEITVTPTATEQVIVFTVTNAGNHIQDINLVATQAGNGTTNPFGGAIDDNFNATLVEIFIERTGSATAGYDSGDETAGPVIDDLAIDETINVYVVSTMPNILDEGDIAVVSLTATILTEGGAVYAGPANPAATAGEDVVFVDAAGYSDNAAERDHSDVGAYEATAPTMNVSKAVSVIDDGFGNSGDFADAYALPGAIIEYEITASNTGSIDADSVVIVDAIPANTNYLVGFAATAAPAADDIEWSDDNGSTWTHTPTVGPDGISDPDLTHIRVTYNTVAQGSGDHIVTFRVVIE